MLIDTSGLLAMFDAGDRHQHVAVGLFEAASLKLWHNYIAAEFVALAHVRGHPRKRFLMYIAEMAAQPDVDFVWIDRSLHEAAMSLLLAQLDKGYSPCDAVSFVLMRNRGIREALTTDQHFERAGFQRLLV